MQLTDLGQDIVIEIGSFLDTISLVRLLSSSKAFWNLKLIVPSFALRIKQFQKLLSQHRLRPYNDALIESAKRGHISDIFFLSNKLVQMYEGKIKELKTETELRQWENTIKNIWNDVMCATAAIGNKGLIDFFIDQGATDWNGGLAGASRGGHKELVTLFLDKGATDLNVAMSCAARGGHKELIEFFIEKGASGWNWSMEGAVLGGHKDLVDVFVKRGATDWVGGMRSAVPRTHQTFTPTHKRLMEFFGSKGANWGVALTEGLRQGHTEPEFIDYVLQKDGIDRGYLLEAQRIIPYIEGEDLVERFETLINMNLSASISLDQFQSRTQ